MTIKKSNGLIGNETRDINVFLIARVYEFVDWIQLAQHEF
jgi:hypothetical protein